MDEEVFNMQLRRFLKKVGIQSQREIEQAVRQGIETGALTSTEKLNAQVLLRVPAVGVDVTIEDEIALRWYFSLTVAVPVTELQQQLMTEIKSK